MQRLRTFFLTAVIITIAFTAAGCKSSSDDSSGMNILVVTDVHFTPFYDPDLFDLLVESDASRWRDIFESSDNNSLPNYGEEGNYPLFDMTMEDASLNMPEPSLIIYPGDILAHHFSTLFYRYYGSEDEDALKSFIYKTVEFFAIEIREYYPKAPVIFTLGNNDSYAGDYNLVTGGDFLADTSGMFRNYFLPDFDLEDYTATYQAGGYYKGFLDDNATMLISLNSVLFSHRRPEPSEPGEGQDAAWDQLDWLGECLATARDKGRQVLMVTHVPPGADIYTTQHNYLDENGTLTGAELIWHTAYHERFLALVQEYRDNLAIIYAGHTHMDELRLVGTEGSESSGVPVLVTSSVSPLFGNNPGYKALEGYQNGPDIYDYQAHTMLIDGDTPKFERVYGFREQYGVGSPDSSGLDSLYNLMHLGDESLISAYKLHYYGGSSNTPINDNNWPVYLCGIKTMTVQEMLDCVNSSQ